MHLKPKSKSKAVKFSSDQGDDLILKRKGGGSIIDHRPLFSSDGEILYVVWKQVIRAYSAQTGDFVKEFQPADHKIISISLSPDNSYKIIGCIDNAELVYWNCQNGLISTKKKLLIPDNSDIKIKTFHLINYKTFQGKNVCNALISFIMKRGEEKVLRVELFDLKLGDRSLSKDINNFNDEEYYIDIIGNHGENLIAVGQSSFLYIISPMYRLKFLRHKTGRNITCISGHPEEECVATGDTSGRILVWRNISQFSAVRATYHWHTLPVTEIVFSRSGGHMYSGGSECVLVKWLLSNPQNKSFLPRLPAPIRHLTIAPENIYVAVSTLDNGIVIVNIQRKLTAVIQNFTWGTASSPTNLFPTGLTVDPRTNNLVLNSRTGHLQFYNTHTKSLLYNLNITAQNLLTQERSAIIVNTEVTRIAINCDGSWMATMEERDDNISHIEVRLKFWHFNMEKQSFVLNTSVELPHEKGVHTVKFKPKSSISDDDQFVVTVGKDKKFKIWNLADSPSTEKKTKHWKCYSVGFYRSLPALDAGFSTDGSLIGVSFDSTLTLWVPETSEFKSSLSYSRYLQPITRVEFGKQECCHLVVTTSSEHLAVWDLLTLTVKWSVLLNVATLTADPLSSYMASFTTDNTLFVFTPASPEIVYTKKNVVEKDVAILGACFVPNIQNTEENSVKWQKKSQLFFLDSEQELLTLESKSESSRALENLSATRNLPLTAFNRIVAAERISHTEKQSYIHDYAKVTSKGMVDELLTVPAHTLPPMRMICMPFLLSLIGKSSKSDANEKSRSIMDVDEESDSEEEGEKMVLSTNSQEKTLDNDIDTKDEEKELINLDWNFLSTILPSNVSS